MDITKLHKLKEYEGLIVGSYKENLQTIATMMVFHCNEFISAKRLHELVYCSMVRFAVFLSHLPETKEQAIARYQRSIRANINAYGEMIPRELLIEMLKQSFTMSYTRLSTPQDSLMMTASEKKIADKLDHYILQFWEGVDIIENTFGDNPMRVLSYSHDHCSEYFVDGLKKMIIAKSAGRMK